MAAPSGWHLRLSHPLDPLLVDADAPEQRFKDLAERQGKEANCAELHSVGHLLQNGAGLLLDFIRSSPRLLGNLHNDTIHFSVWISPVAELQNLICNFISSL